MKLRLRRIGIDTARESIAFLDDDNLISHALGFHPMDRIEISANGKSIRARWHARPNIFALIHVWVAKVAP